MVGFDLVDDRPDETVDLLIGTVIGSADIADAVIADQFHHLHAFLARTGIVDGDRMSSLLFDQFHTRNIGRPVAEINHVTELHRTLLLLDILVDPHG